MPMPVGPVPSMMLALLMTLVPLPLISMPPPRPVMVPVLALMLTVLAETAKPVAFVAWIVPAFSMIAASLARIAPAPEILPGPALFTMTLVSLPTPEMATPLSDEMVPEFATVRFPLRLTRIASPPEEPVTEILRELVTSAPVEPKIAKPPASAEIVPELVTVAKPVANTPDKGPWMVPRFPVTVTVWPSMPELVVPTMEPVPLLTVMSWSALMPERTPTMRPAPLLPDA